MTDQKKLDSWEVAGSYSRKVVTLWEETDGYKVNIYNMDYGHESVMRFVFKDQSEAAMFFALTKKAWVIY